ncbi:plexin-C1-like [Acanthochromis polyacanthus]|uniref:plexin-C1-like n=1 Tax=Acanthochromis polyacanthus TaxID=80966 RepID=UPI00223401BB|nr:plexin-C1-like [Acanthochromis polyacanthus]
MIQLLVLISVLWGEQGLCLHHHGEFLFDEDIRQFAVATSGVYVATDTKLYQLRHDLTLVRSLTLGGILKSADDPNDERFYRVSETAAWNATFSVSTLLPFVKNNSVFICGMADNQCGYCEVLDLHDISKLLYREHIQVGPLRHSSGSVSFLVDLKKNPTRSETYILTAIQQPERRRCISDSQTINLQDADHDQNGGIFSFTDSSGTAVIRSTGDVEFVDGFQISSVIFLFSNVMPEGNSNRVRLLWFDGIKRKCDTLKSVKGVILSVSDGGGNRLLASSVIPGPQPVLWSGVFSVDEGESNTELVVFDISPDMSGQTDKDSDFHTSKDKPEGTVTPKTLRPKAVLFRQNFMTSVLAVRQKAWMVFFIGTAEGQLIKLAVDRNFHPACPTLLYSGDDDRKVFPRILLDPVDQKHVYVPFRNQMERVAVAKCSTYTNFQDCCSAQDPHCVWCASTTSCTFEDDCKDSDWLAIPDDSQQKMVSHKVVKDSSGQIVLRVQTHLTVGQNPSNFACQFSATSSELCSHNSPLPQFPQCTCILSNGMLPADGMLVTIKIRLQMTQLSEQVRVTDCPDINGPPSSALCQQCIKAGCGWSRSGCSWANEGVSDDGVCQRMEYRGSFSRPEISYITPSIMSFYGRNHAMLSGRNLKEVTGVRIQGDLDCSPRESPVWNNTGVSLTFHIPSTDNKGVVKVCVLLPDGSCHGNTIITYRSAPSCTDIVPNSSWISGKREITLIGSNLEFVEEVVHSHALQEVRLPKNSSYQKLTYDSPAAEKWISSSTVYLKVANQTLACSTRITYYPDPEFTKFTSVRTGDDVLITIEKKADKLEMTEAELSVWGVHEDIMYPCSMTAQKASSDFFVCEIVSPPDPQFQHLKIKYGDKTVSLRPLSLLHKVIMTLRLLLIPCIVAALVFICRWQKRLTADKNKL